MAIQNLDRLRRKLKALPEAATLAIRPVMERIANDVVALAKNLVPVKTGDLRDSIGWTWGEAPKGTMVLGKVKAKTTGNLAITIFAGGNAAFYARWVEFGTSRGNFSGEGSRAQPFFYPAWRAHRRGARSKLSRAINKSAKKVAAAG
jgi:HK97 gp10 family phage protein